MAKQNNTPSWKVSERKPKKTRQGISRNSKGHKKYRGQGGPCKRRKKQFSTLNRYKYCYGESCNNIFMSTML